MDTHTPGMDTTNAHAGVFEECCGVTERELGDRGMKKRNHRLSPTFCWLAVHRGFSGLPIFGKQPCVTAVGWNCGGWNWRSLARGEMRAWKSHCINISEMFLSAVHSNLC